MIKIRVKADVESDFCLISNQKCSVNGMDNALLVIIRYDAEFSESPGRRGLDHIMSHIV